MLQRRNLFNCRLKTRVAIYGFIVIFISFLLLYRSIISHNANSHNFRSAIDNKYQQQLHSQQKNIIAPIINNVHNSIHANLDEHLKFKNDLILADLIPQQSEKVKNRDLLSVRIKEVLTKFLSKLYPKNWADVPESDEVALDLKYLLIDYGFESNMSCKEIDNLRIGFSLLQSQSKYIDYAYDASEESGGGYSGGLRSIGSGSSSSSKKSEVVIRSYCSDLETKEACLKHVYDEELCATMGNYRLLREMLLLNVLKHPNILELKGYCLRGNRVSKRIQDKGVVMVTEVGVPMSKSVIEASSWSQRVSMALQVCHLLLYLENNPLGNLWFTKLNMRDFVLVRGIILKLADLDDLEIGHKLCREDSHCGVAQRSHGARCLSGFCQGSSLTNNFHLAVRDVLQPLLQNTPGKDEAALVLRLASLDITLDEFTAELQAIFNKSPPEGPLRFSRIGSVYVVENQQQHEFHQERQSHEVQNHEFHYEKQNSESHQERRDEVVKNVKGIAEGENTSIDDVLSQFSRYNQRNFAGIYDYKCSGSRVSWGCVHTVTGVLEAARLCLSDQECKAFVVFTTKPESDTLMTVILKNDSDSSPYTSTGTTLFIRQKQVKSHQAEKKVGDEEVMRLEKKGENVVKRSSVEVHNCVDDVFLNQETARYTREKRLMTHVGLKGIGEKGWKKSALKLKVEGAGQIVKSETAGGWFLANLTKLNPDDASDKVKNVVFIAEDGPEMYHLAYAMVYQLDRLLGLYAVPPCVGRELSAETVESYRSNSSQWEDIFKTLVESDGILSGIMVPPEPSNMKATKLTLEPLEAMTQDVVQRSRSDRLQLEYILLWWLGKIEYGKKNHHGYKGHFIHFFADRAFSDPDLDLSAYLYHCQFPSVAYKILDCFRCESKHKAVDNKSNVCFFGEEVIKRTRAMFTEHVEFLIHGMRESALVEAMDSAASSALFIVDSCIKKFGRSSTLY